MTEIKERTYKKEMTVGVFKRLGLDLNKALKLSDQEIKGLEKLPIELSWDFLTQFTNELMNEPELYLNDDTPISEYMNEVKRALSSSFLESASKKS